MRTLIHAAMDRSRTTLLLLSFLIMGGIAAFNAIPKESNPDVTIPTIYISVTLEGVSPEDAERLLVRPLEQELRSLEGIKEMRATAAEGYAAVVLEFDAGFNPDQALQDVREKVDAAQSELPPRRTSRLSTKSMFRSFPSCPSVFPGRCPSVS